MTKVFVKRNALTSGDAVDVIASCDDDVDVDPATYGSDVVALSLPSSVVTFPTLAKDWRDRAKSQIISAEATRRIDSVFPEHSQRNSLAEVNGYITNYGADAGKWPPAARQRKTEIDRCWDYVNAVRAKATGLGKSALPPDPTANSQWPTVIGPYQPL